MSRPIKQFIPFALLIVAFVFILFLSLRASEASVAIQNAKTTIENFENTMKGGVNTDLLNYFSPDSLEQDKDYRNKILDDIINKKDQVNFNIINYRILDFKNNKQEFMATITETRDYKEKTADYGKEFLRIVILEKIKGEYKIKEYKKTSEKNAFSGSLSGSVKYSGFYP